MSGAEAEVADLLTPDGPVPLRVLSGPLGRYLLAGDADSRWTGTLAREGAASLSEGRAVQRFGVELVRDDSERRAVLDAARARFGEARVARWFPRPGPMFRLVERAASGGIPYATWLVSEFDRVASTYEEQLRANPVEEYLRARSLEEIRRRLSDRARLLEVGGGVGVETIPMLEAGHEVTVVDVAPAMLEQLRERARGAGVAERLTTVVGTLRDIASRDELGAFDGAWSTFGAVNCEPELSRAVDGFARRLRPGAPLVLAVLNRWAVLELLGYSATFRFSRAGARLGSTLRVGDSRFSIDCFPYSVAEVLRAFGPAFDLESLEGLLVALPPPDWLAGRHPSGPALARLERLDRWLGRRWPFRSWGDHALITWVRSGSDRSGGKS